MTARPITAMRRSRREILGGATRLTLGAGALSAFGGFCGCGSMAMAQGISGLGAGPVVPRDKGYLVQEIRDGLYWLTDGSYSTMFLVSSEGVIAIDAPPTTGANYLKAVAEVTDKPVTHLVYSHEHVDHIAGAHLFPTDVTIVGHRETAKVLARRKDPKRPPPTLVWDDDHTLTVGDQRLELSYKGINHSVDNCFVYAPRQRTLLFIDVIYPGWMPYKNLGVAVDVPGFVEAHRQVLSYDFDTLVAGHVSRPGTRTDVLTQIELIKDLAEAAERAYARLSFPAYLKQNPPAPPGSGGRTSWDLHDPYESALVDGMVSELLPKWRTRLAGTETYLRDNCWAMLETYVVQGAPDTSWIDSALATSAPGSRP